MEAVKSNTVPADFISFAKYVAYNYDKKTIPNLWQKQKFKFTSKPPAEDSCTFAWYETLTETYFIDPSGIYKNKFGKEFIFWVLIDLWLIKTTENFRYADNMAYKITIRNDFDIEILYKDIKKFLKIVPSKLNKKRLKNIKKIKTLL